MSEESIPSITSWMRLEPRSRNADMDTSLQARVYDPLWLLARQWQLGEFQGEDNGSPVLARWRAEAAQLNHYLPGDISKDGQNGATSFDAGLIPLEALVERESIWPANDVTEKPEKLRLAAEAGQHFLRLLEQQKPSKSYRQIFIDHFPFPPFETDQGDPLDPDSQIFLKIVGRRVPDGRQLYTAFRSQPGGSVELPAGLPIEPDDVAEVSVAAENWIEWCDSFFSKPGEGGSSWSAERMEYAFSVATRLSDGEHVLTAQEYTEGHLDWFAFDEHPKAVLSVAENTPVSEITSTAIPAPVSFRGMPAARFWEFEDAQVDFGSVDAGPTDLARMLLVEFALDYGNDWFVIPVELEVGSLCRTRSFVITDTFGVRTLIKPNGAPDMPDPQWRMFQLSQLRGSKMESPAENPYFFLPPALLKNLESKPIEEVLFFRDEMANLAWGVERLIESPSEGLLNRFEAYIEQERRRGQESSRQPATTPGTLHYRLSTEVPDYWIPLMPVKVKTKDGLRLMRGAVLDLNGNTKPVPAKGRILEAGHELSLFEEEIPREGVRVTRSFQFTRWIDGSSHLWIGRRKGVGRGEGSSGLKFDSLDGKA